MTSKEIILQYLAARDQEELAAVHGIKQRAFLRTPDVKKQLLKLMATKSIADDPFAVKRFREAVDAIA